MTPAELDELRRLEKASHEANPGSELVLPDYADLCVWLMGQYDELRQRAARAESEGEHDQRRAEEQQKRAERAEAEMHQLQLDNRRFSDVNDALDAENQRLRQGLSQIEGALIPGANENVT